MYEYNYIYIYTYIYVSICLYNYIYIYIHIPQISHEINIPWSSPTKLPLRPARCGTPLPPPPPGPVPRSPGKEVGGSEVVRSSWWNHGDTMGIPWENHGETMGKPWFYETFGYNNWSFHRKTSWCKMVRCCWSNQKLWLFNSHHITNNQHNHHNRLKPIVEPPSEAR